MTLLSARGGNPAWGPEILARNYWLDTMDELPPLYSDWERWAATVSESHSNYPALIWFRSPVSSTQLAGRAGRHDGLGGAVSRHQPDPDAAPGAAAVCPWASAACAPWLGRCTSSYDADPLPTAGTRLTKEEFEDGFRRLHEVNWPAERDLDESWRELPGLARELRTHRRRADAPHHAATVAVVRGPARARRGGVAGGDQPHARGARGVLSRSARARPSRPRPRASRTTRRRRAPGSARCGA